jgi:hypothetical protein
MICERPTHFDNTGRLVAWLSLHDLQMKPETAQRLAFTMFLVRIFIQTTSTLEHLPVTGSVYTGRNHSLTTAMIETSVQGCSVDEGQQPDFSPRL